MTTPGPVQIERKVRQLDNDVQSIYDILTGISGTQLRQGNRLEEIDTRLGELDTRLTGRLDELDTRLTSRLDVVDVKLGELDTKLGALDTKLDTVITMLGAGRG